MTVLNQDDLEKARGQTLEDIQQLVPSFSMENQAGYNVLTMRGVGGGGRNIGFDPRVGVYLDGVYMGQAQALLQPLFDVEQVEVMRGPQGHLFGRNTVAGAVNVTTRAPTSQFEGSARGMLGSHGAYESHATISGPMTPTVLGKISLATESRDGFTTNLFDGQKLDDLKRSGARGQIVILPTDKLRVSIAADSSRAKQRLTQGEPVSDLFGLPLSGGPLPAHVVNFNTTPSEEVRLYGGNLTANYTLDSGHVMTTILGYRSTHEVLQLDNDYSPNDLLRISYLDRFKQYSEEIRIASPDKEKTRYVIGLYHLNETAQTNRTATIGLDAATTLVRHPLIPGLVPFTAVAGTVPGAQATNDGEVKTATTALFGALDYDYTETVTLNLGARYTHETKDVLFNLDGSASGNFAIGSLNGYRDSLTENNISPSIGATWKASQNQNLYVKYSRGFKSGGWNTEFLTVSGAQQPAFGTERADSYEAGSKGTLLGGRLRYDLAAYVTRFKDFQVFQFVDLGGGATSMELRNAAEAETRGVDAGFMLSATSRLGFGLNFGLIKATFKRFDTCSPIVNCTGHRLPYAPGFTSAATANYRMYLPNFGGRLDLYGEYSYHGKSFMDPVNDESTQRIPSRQRVNLRLGYIPDNSHWDFSLWAKNLFDADTVTMRDRDFLGNLTVRRMDPRTAGFEARYSFY